MPLASVKISLLPRVDVLSFFPSIPVKLLARLYGFRHIGVNISIYLVPYLTKKSPVQVTFTVQLKLQSPHWPSCILSCPSQAALLTVCSWREPFKTWMCSYCFPYSIPIIRFNQWPTAPDIFQRSADPAWPVQDTCRVLPCPLCSSTPAPLSIPGLSQAPSCLSTSSTLSNCMDSSSPL